MRNRFAGPAPGCVSICTFRTFVLASVFFGPAAWATAQDAVSKWTAQLQNPNETARIQAIDALGRLGPAAKGAVKDLAAPLNDKSANVRAHAAHDLQTLGPIAADAAEALAKAAADPDPHVRRTAIGALQRIRPEPKLAIAVLGKALEDTDPSVRVTALSALTSAGEAAIPTLTQGLGNPEIRYWAALALGELGPRAKSATDALTAALKDERPEVRREVLVALARIGVDASAAAPAIAPLLSDADPSVGHAAAFALGRIGTAAATAADALRQARKSKDPLMQTVSAWALAHIEPKNEAQRADAIKLLTSALKDENPRVQVAALKGLAELEEDPAKLVPILADVLCQGDEALVDEAFQAAAALGEAATPALIDALKRPEARARATVLIARLGAKASAAIPALTAALGDANPEVRREVLFALASMGADAAPAQAAVVKALGDPEVRVRAIAAYALGSIGAAAQGAAPKLRTELESTDPVVRVASAWALVHVSPKSDQIAPEVLPVLMQGLRNENTAVRRGSADALGRLGKAGRTAEGGLRAAARDPDESVRKAALAALERMGAVLDSPLKRSVPVRPNNR